MMKQIGKGLLGLVQSTKGTLCILILGVSSYALLTSKLDGVSFAAICSTIATLFMWTRSRTDIAAFGIQK